MTNTFEITNVEPAASIGNAIVEGYINDEVKFAVTIETTKHNVQWINLNGETVYAAHGIVVEDGINNPIDAALLEDMKALVRNKVRTIRAR
ncbi:hypothetical protein [Sporosarcina phage Lietuvens]|nr:hypothetical protein [Sporosarcina phage Lietuvens]